MSPSEFALPFNPFAPPHQEDPYPVYAHARKHLPVFFNPIFNLWMVTRYSDVVAVLRDPQRFSSKPTLRLPPNLPPPVREILKESTAEEESVVNEDPPQHTQRRALIGKAFVPQRIEAMAPRVRAIAERLFAGFAKSGQVEHMEAFARLLPMSVICDIIGVPAQDVEQVRQWTDEWVGLLSGSAPLDMQLVYARGIVSCQRYMEELAEARRRAPKDDLTTDLIGARMDGAQLTTVELGTFLRGMVAAGYETTAGLVGSLMQCLLSDREQWQAVVADRKLIPAAIDETLRFKSPLRGMLRAVTGPTELGGAPLPAGTLLMPLFASANRDEQVFSEPDRFDLRRTDKDKHLGFGRGIHSCLGSLLARLEAQVTVELYAELPNLRLQEGQRYAFEPHLLAQKPQSLQLVWG